MHTGQKRHCPERISWSEPAYFCFSSVLRFMGSLQYAGENKLDGFHRCPLPHNLFPRPEGLSDELPAQLALLGIGQRLKQGDMINQFSLWKQEYRTRLQRVLTRR